MRLSTPSGLRRSSSSPVFWSGDSVLFQEMCNSAPCRITVETWIARKTGQCWGKSYICGNEKMISFLQQRILRRLHIDIMMALPWQNDLAAAKQYLRATTDYHIPKTICEPNLSLAATALFERWYWAYNFKSSYPAASWRASSDSESWPQIYGALLNVHMWPEPTASLRSRTEPSFDGPHEDH